jgi:hypothetical protein
MTMFSTMMHQQGESIRCCCEVLTSLITLFIPGFLLAVIAAVLSALILSGGDPVLLTSHFKGIP